MPYSSSGAMPDLASTSHKSKKGKQAEASSSTEFLMSGALGSQRHASVQRKPGRISMEEEKNDLSDDENMITDESVSKPAYSSMIYALTLTGLGTPTEGG